MVNTYIYINIYNNSKNAKIVLYLKTFVVGAVDGTHIVIDPPKDGKDDYIDRKGQTSICLQGICDENRKFIDIFVGYPGSVHDSRVLQNSFIFPKLERLCKGIQAFFVLKNEKINVCIFCLDYWILGDSAYPLQKAVLTPYRDNGHLSSSQKFYNRKLSSARVYIEHTFGILKQRFRQLYYCKLRGMDKLCHFVRACCVLHNLANDTDLNFQCSAEVEMLNNTVEHESCTSSSTVAKTQRNSVCDELWTNKT